MGLIDFLSKPLQPEEDDYKSFLEDRGVEGEDYRDYYNYHDAYEHYRETGVDPFDYKAKHWTSKFKHPLSPERYISDEGKWFDTIKNKYTTKDEVAMQHIKRLEYLKNLPIEEYEKR